jgi:hypothetical protein
VSAISQTRRVVVFTALTAIALAGCGGGGSSSSSTGGGGTSASRAALVAQADPICKQVAVKRAAANASIHGTGAATLPALSRLAPGMAVFEQTAVDKLRALKAPASASKEWQALLVGMEQLAIDDDRIGAEAKANHLKAVEATVTSGRSLREELAKIASRNGFKYCGIAS